MAFFLDFQKELEIAERLQSRKKCSQQVVQLEYSLYSFVRQLEMTDVTPFLQNKDAQKSHFTINFTLKTFQHFSALYRLSIQSKMKTIGLSIRILEDGKFCRVRSGELIRNISKMVKSINNMASKSLVYLVISPKGGELLVKTYANYNYNDSSNIPAYLKSSIAQTYNFIKSFFPVLAYSANLMPRSSVETQLNPPIRNIFFGNNREFVRHSEIYQLLPLINCPLEIQSDTETDIQKNSNPKRIIQLFYDQKYGSQKKEIQLYCEPQLFNSQSQLNTFKKSALNIDFPKPKDTSNNNPFVFNTILIRNRDKRNEKIIAEGGRAKIIASQTRFVYCKSMNFSQESNCSKPKSYKTEDQSTEETDEPEATSSQMDKILLIKVPKSSPKQKDFKKLMGQISYERDLITNFRSIGCGYLPKYYHSPQKDYQYSPYLLMDYVAGNTLSEEMQKKYQTLTFSSKMHIISHLSNALRFLDQYEVAHLDLSPSNVIVVKDFLIKIIDFGEAYHKKTAQKYSMRAGRGEVGKYIYSPGRTFPYAPPETSNRMDNFTSKQDMYSLGIIMHQLIFGSLPFVCSQQTHKKLFRENSYSERIFLAPERAQNYGQSDLIVIIMHLIIKLMDCDQKRRPLPIWAHIIIKKIFYSIH